MPTLTPYVISLIFYAITIAFCELCRQLIQKYSTGNLKVFLLEFIATLQVCTTVYENGLVLKHYGVAGFFLAVTILILVHGLINRGANVLPCVTIENWVYSQSTSRATLLLLGAELSAAYCAFGLVRNIWKISSLISPDHAQNLQYFHCVLPFKVPFLVACAFEFGGCFLIKYVVSSTSPSRRRYVASILTATLLSINVMYIGAAALNPIIASARFAGCKGLSNQDHVIMHWVCTVTGWLAAAYLKNNRSTTIKID